MSLRLRLARSDEADTVRALARVSYARHVPNIGREPAPMTEDYTARVAEGTVQVLVDGPEETGGILGYLILFDEPDALMLDNVAVAEHAQGRGLGRYLVEAAEAEARARGYDLVRLYTNAKMTGNIALYTHLGFEETARVTEKMFERVYMEKRLG
ncbi:GNAT family N-acetyltransferase [Chachezhania sediminis]|uniref:GNAT family N-acetyltransferase n=1 Tax=Chachezhania sediminis TaxID=2599291 RepID=UPI001E4B7D7D|nr:GNAT family N-acetyltransferase [Chachezhania sediminis]